MLVRIFSVSDSVSNGARLVAELVRGGDQRAVAQVEAVEAVVAGRRPRCAERRVPFSARHRALDEERAEAVADPRDRAELGIEAVDESARRGGDRHGGEVDEQGARDRVRVAAAAAWSFWKSPVCTCWFVTRNEMTSGGVCCAAAGIATSASIAVTAIVRFISSDLDLLR